MEIITNNQARPVIYWHDLTEKERAEFDYCDDELSQECFRAFRYRGEVHDINQFSPVYTRSQQARSLSPFAITVEDDDSLAKWHGAQSDTFFSGLCVKYVDDCESVIVGRYFS